MFIHNVCSLRDTRERWCALPDMSPENQTSLIYVLVIILVPIIPGFIFFKWFKSQGSVVHDSAKSNRGKQAGSTSTDGHDYLAAFTNALKDWRIRLGGAFAGYFAILIVLLVILHPQIKFPKQTSTILWTIVGVLAPEQQMNPEKQISFSSSRETFTGKAYPDNKFEISLRLNDGEDLPDIFIQPDPALNLKPVPILLAKEWSQLPNDLKINRDEVHHIITIVEPIKLIKPPPYQPSGAPTPSPVQGQSGMSSATPSP